MNDNTAYLAYLNKQILDLAAQLLLLIDEQARMDPEDATATIITLISRLQKTGQLTTMSDTANKH